MQTGHSGRSVSHKDIDDAGQTVHLSENPPEVPEEPTETPSVSNPVKTGDDTPVLLYLASGRRSCPCRDTDLPVSAQTETEG